MAGRNSFGTRLKKGSVELSNLLYNLQSTIADFSTPFILTSIWNLRLISRLNNFVLFACQNTIINKKFWPITAKSITWNQHEKEKKNILYSFIILKRWWTYGHQRIKLFWSKQTSSLYKPKKDWKPRLVKFISHDE